MLHPTTLVTYICGICACECSDLDSKATPYAVQVNSLLNGQQLIPKMSYPVYDLFDGKLLDLGRGCGHDGLW